MAEPGVGFNICLALAHSYCLLSCAHILHTLPCSAMPSSVRCYSLWFPGMPRISGPHNSLNEEEPSSDCLLRTSLASAQQPRAAKLPGRHPCTFPPGGAPHHLLISFCPAPGFPRPAQLSGAEFQQDLLKYWGIVQLLATVLSFCATITFEKQWRYYSRSRFCCLWNIFPDHSFLKLSRMAISFVP